MADAPTPPSRLFAIGDVHGRLDRLDGLLARLDGLDPSARLVFLGDYFDRGSRAREVIDRLIGLGRARPDTVFLLGNHEDTLLRYESSRSAEDLRILRSMGFQATMDSYEGPPRQGLDFMPDTHLAFLHGLRRIHSWREYVFFHSPLRFGDDPDMADPVALEAMLNRRTPDWEGWAASGKTLVFGHMSLELPLMAPGLIGIDTGAGYGRMLTAVELPERRFHHA